MISSTKYFIQKDVCSSTVILMLTEKLFFRKTGAFCMRILYISILFSKSSTRYENVLLSQ